MTESKPAEKKAAPPPAPKAVTEAKSAEEVPAPPAPSAAGTEEPGGDHAQAQADAADEKARSKGMDVGEGGYEGDSFGPGTDPDDPALQDSKDFAPEVKGPTSESLNPSIYNTEEDAGLQAPGQKDVDQGQGSPDKDQLKK